MNSLVEIPEKIISDRSSLLFRDKLIEANNDYSFNTQYIEDRWNVDRQNLVCFPIENKNHGDYFTFEHSRRKHSSCRGYGSRTKIAETGFTSSF